VEHVLEKNTIRFYICATKNIPEGKEITMPFSYDYRKWFVSCSSFMSVYQVDVLTATVLMNL